MEIKNNICNVCELSIPVVILNANIVLLSLYKMT